MHRILDLPLIVILMGIGALAMYVPAAHALAVGQEDIARAFFYSGSLFLVLAAVMGLATIANHPGNRARSQLLALVGTFTLLPLMLAVPFSEAVRDTTLFNAWWEMVSSLTTTGATLYDAGHLPGSVHLWRALVGWMGGFFILVVAIAVLAPMNLGGFEVLTGTSAGMGAVTGAQVSRVADPSERLARYAWQMLPIYAGLTLVLWIALLIAGDSALVAACHAMSTLSTSGITPTGGLANGEAGRGGEVLIFAFLFFALSRRLYPGGHMRRIGGQLANDPELRLGLLLVGGVTVTLFARHWIGAFEVNAEGDLSSALTALWGTAFTVLSFLTTTGFHSADWGQSQTWSGLATPGLVLAGLAVIGGGVATTAGGVKLLRVYALFRHGEREVERLVHPSSVGGAGVIARRLRREGALMAWIFFMLFALSIAVVMMALSLTGLDFEASTILAVSALSTTGPLAETAAAAPLSWAMLDDAAKVILAAAMVLGRLETLAIIALLNPDFWRS
jgi:trk system potassium uptake protein TrkH